MWMEETADGKFKYRERYTDPYTEKYRTVSITLLSNSRQAQNKAQRLLNDKIDKKLSITSERSDTFKNVLEEWKNVYKHTVKETTYWRNEWNVKLIRKFIADDVIVRNIDAELIRSGLEKMYYEENYAYSTVKQCKTIIKVILDYAKNKKLINHNPVNEVKIKRKSLKYEELEKIENKFLEKEELKKIVDILRNEMNSKRHADLAEFMALTGVRIGEALALTYDCLNENSLSINATLDYTTKKTIDFHKSTPKTEKSNRVIDLTKRAMDILDEIHLENSLNNASYFVDREIFFCSRTGTPIHMQNFNENLKRAASMAGINKTVTSHILRHTHISLLAENKIPVKAIMDRIGHADVQITNEIYTHMTKTMRQDILDTLEKIEF